MIYVTRRSRTISRIAGVLPLILSAASFSLIIFSVTTGWELGGSDEGAAAHIFQLMMSAQLPLIAIFLFTADWRDRRLVVLTLLVQAAAIAAVIATGLYFRI